MFGNYFFGAFPFARLALQAPLRAFLRSPRKPKQINIRLQLRK